MARQILVGEFKTEENIALICPEWLCAPFLLATDLHPTIWVQILTIKNIYPREFTDGNWSLKQQLFKVGLKDG